MDECERLTYVSGEAACNAVDIATALGGGFHVSFPPGRGTMTLIKYFPDGSDVSIEVGDDRAAASNSRFETVEWDIEDGIPQKLVDMLHPYPMVGRASRPLTRHHRKPNSAPPREVWNELGSRQRSEHLQANHVHAGRVGAGAEAV